MVGAARSRLSLPPALHHCTPGGHCPPDAGAARWVRRLGGEGRGREGMLRGWHRPSAEPGLGLGGAGEPERSEASAALPALPALLSICARSAAPTAVHKASCPAECSELHLYVSWAVRAGVPVCEKTFCLANTDPTECISLYMQRMPFPQPLIEESYLWVWCAIYA